MDILCQHIVVGKNTCEFEVAVVDRAIKVC
jgi:hypothetical protein